KIQVNPFWATRLLFFNARRKPLGDANFRRAILHGLDRDLLPAFLKNGERRVTGLIPPGLPGYRELPLVTADLARAQEEPGGAASFELLPLPQDREPDRNVARGIAQQLEKTKIGVNVVLRDTPGFTRDFDSGRFDLAFSVWTFNVASPAEILRSFSTAS